MCIDSNKRLPLLLATAIVGMVNICNAVPAVGAPMPADSNAVSFVGISRDAEGDGERHGAVSEACEWHVGDTKEVS